MIDVSALQLLLVTVAAWLDRREREMLAYLIEANRLLRRQPGERRLCLTDADRRRLAALAHRLGRRLLRDVATIVTPDTLLRWHRQLIARNGRIQRGAQVDSAFSARFADWSCGWPGRTPRGATHASRARSRMSGIESDDRRLHES